MNISKYTEVSRWPSQGGPKPTEHPWEDRSGHRPGLLDRLLNLRDDLASASQIGHGVTHNCRIVPGPSEHGDVVDVPGLITARGRPSVKHETDFSGANAIFPTTLIDLNSGAHGRRASRCVIWGTADLG